MQPEHRARVVYAPGSVTRASRGGPVQTPRCRCSRKRAAYRANAGIDGGARDSNAHFLFRAQGRRVPKECAVGTAVLVGLVVWRMPPQQQQQQQQQQRPAPQLAPPAPAKVSLAEVKAVLDQRCARCHNAQVQQKNVALHTPQLIKQHAQAVYQQAVVLKLMPLNNATRISDAQRADDGSLKRPFSRPWPPAPEARECGLPSESAATR